VAFLGDDELIVADGRALLQYDLRGERLGHVRVELWVEHMQLLSPDALLLLGSDGSASVLNPRSGVVGWRLTARGVAQRLVVARDGRWLARLPGMQHAKVPTFAECFQVEAAGSHQVWPPRGVDWRGGAWLTEGHLALHGQNAVFLWRVETNSLDLVTESSAEITALGAMDEHVAVGFNDGSIALVSP
jgi:hypothetical protein